MRFERRCSLSGKFFIFVANAMAYSVILLFINYLMVICVVGQDIDKDVEIISGKDHPQNHPLDAKIIGHYANDIYGPSGPEPNWRGWSMLWANEGDGKHGEVSFRQIGPVNPVLVNINATGLPPGKHAVHIHAFGDMRMGCKSTGPHMRGILIGNIDIPESGNLDLSFFSPHIQLFGHRGVIGRSIVIHEKPIEFNRSPDIYGVPVAEQAIQPVSYQTEEMSVGMVLACGMITVVENNAAQ